MVYNRYGGLPLLRRKRPVVAQPLIYVFDIDYGIIDKRPDGNRYASQAHGIDGISHQVENQY